MKLHSRRSLLLPVPCCIFTRNLMLHVQDFMLPLADFISENTPRLRQFYDHLSTVANDKTPVSHASSEEQREMVINIVNLYGSNILVTTESSSPATLDRLLALISPES